MSMGVVHWVDELDGRGPTIICGAALGASLSFGLVTIGTTKYELVTCSDCKEFLAARGAESKWYAPNDFPGRWYYSEVLDDEEASEVQKRLTDHLESAWGIIANAYGGNWEDAQNADWKPAAERWRDEYERLVVEPAMKFANSTPDESADMIKHLDEEVEETYEKIGRLEAELRKEILRNDESLRLISELRSQLAESKKAESLMAMKLMGKESTYTSLETTFDMLKAQRDELRRKLEDVKEHVKQLEGDNRELRGKLSNRDATIIMRDRQLLSLSASIDRLVDRQNAREDWLLDQINRMRSYVQEVGLRGGK